MRTFSQNALRVLLTLDEIAPSSAGSPKENATGAIPNDRDRPLEQPLRISHQNAFPGVFFCAFTKFAPTQLTVSLFTENALVGSAMIRFFGW